MAGCVAVRLVFWRASKRKADLDNLVKTVLDALNQVAWEDDDQIDLLEACKRRTDVAAPCTTISMVET